MKFWRTALMTIITIASTLFFAWLSTTVNTGDSSNPSFFAFMTAFVSLMLFFGGIFLTVFTFFRDAERRSWLGDPND